MVADDYDELVDSPIYCGNAAIHEFEVAGKKHYLVNEGEGGVWDGPASAQAVRQIVRRVRPHVGRPAVSKYVFFNMLIESGGGLEHKTSTWMNASRWAWRTRRNPTPDGRRRLRPGPRAIAPGLARAGQPRVLPRLERQASAAGRTRPLRLRERRVHSQPLDRRGRHLLLRSARTAARRALQPGAIPARDVHGHRPAPEYPGPPGSAGRAASYDAWIKLYRPDENSPNTAISYYTKGEVVGFLLDAKIRKATNGAKSLDDVMKLAYQRYSGARGYTPEQFRRTASEVAGKRLRPVVPLRSRPPKNSTTPRPSIGMACASDAAAAPARGALGAITANQNGRLVVTGLRRGTAATRRASTSTTRSWRSANFASGRTRCRSA